MSTSVRAHFEARAALLADCATLDVNERDGATWMTLRPHAPEAVGVVLYLSGFGEHGTVSFDDPASAPAELGGCSEKDLRAIDFFIGAATEGQVTAYRLRSGGVVEVRTDGGVDRTWHNVLVPLPGWRRRAVIHEYGPYR